MSYRETTGIEHAARSVMAYSIDAGAAAEEQRRALVIALLPAAAILLAAAFVLTRLLSA